MAQNIRYYSEWAKGSQWRSAGPKQDKNPARQTPNPIAPCLMSKDLDGSLHLPLLPVVLTAAHFSLGLAPLSVCSSLQQTSHNSSISNIINTLQASVSQLCALSWSSGRDPPPRSVAAQLLHLNVIHIHAHTHTYIVYVYVCVYHSTHMFKWL